MWQAARPRKPVLPKPAAPATQQWQQALATTHPALQTAPDAQYTSELGANAAPYNTGLAQLPGNVGAAAHQAGYSTYLSDPNDPTSINVGAIDTSNPYSRAALLQKSYDQNRAGATTSMASRGQLYSGAHQNAQNVAQSDFNRDSTLNREGLTGTISSYINNLQQLGAQRLQADTSSFGGLTDRKASDPLLGQVRTNPLPAPKSFFAGQTYKKKKKT